MRAGQNKLAIPQKHKKEFDMGGAAGAAAGSTRETIVTFDNRNAGQAGLKNSFSIGRLSNLAVDFSPKKEDFQSVDDYNKKQIRFKLTQNTLNKMIDFTNLEIVRQNENINNIRDACSNLKELYSKGGSGKNADACNNNLLLKRLNDLEAKLSESLQILIEWKEQNEANIKEWETLLSNGRYDEFTFSKDAPKLRVPREDFEKSLQEFRRILALLELQLRKTPEMSTSEMTSAVNQDKMKKMQEEKLQLESERKAQQEWEGRMYEALSNVSRVVNAASTEILSPKRWGFVKFFPITLP